MQRVLLALALPLFGPSSAAAAAAQDTAWYRVHPSSDTGRTGALSVNAVMPPDGLIHLLLEPRGRAPRDVDLELSEFRDDRGNRLVVRLQLPGETARQRPRGRRRVTLTAPLFPLTLAADTPETADPYRGSLFLVSGDSVVARLPITLRRVPPAKLVVDRRDTIALTTTRSFTVLLYEASGQHPLDGVFVRLIAVQAGGAAFDPVRQVAFEIQGRPVDLWTQRTGDTAEARLRRIPRGDVLQVRGDVRGARPGEYHLRLRFLAANSQEDPQQEVSLILRVRHPVWPAVLVLVVALFVSYFGTKVLKGRYARLQFWSKLDQPAWLRDEPPALPVMWARTILRQAHDLLDRWLLSGLHVIEARVKPIASLLPRLDRLRTLRARIATLHHPWLVRRAEKARQRIVALLGAGGALDDRTAVKVDEALTELEAWFPDQVEAGYWAYLKQDIAALLDSVKPALNGIAPPDTQKAIRTLVGQLEAAAQDDKASLDKKIAYEVNLYATLKVLWERYGQEALATDFGALLALHAQGKNGQELLDEADKLAWKQLKNAYASNGITFTSPRRDSDEAFEAYEPLLFEIKTRDPAVGNNYLFKHKGLTYEWEITLTVKGRTALTLRPTTSEPRVVQYVPRAGQVTVSVTVWRDPRRECFAVRYMPEPGCPPGVPGGGAPGVPGGGPPEPLRLAIADSRDFSLIRSFEFVEVVAVLLTVAVAVVTGLSTVYFEDAAFGATQDYLKLFLWGAAADQFKNALQFLQPATTP